MPSTRRSPPSARRRSTAPADVRRPLAVVGGLVLIGLKINVRLHAADPRRRRPPGRAGAPQARDTAWACTSASTRWDFVGQAFVALNPAWTGSWAVDEAGAGRTQRAASAAPQAGNARSSVEGRRRAQGVQLRAVVVAFFIIGLGFVAAPVSPGPTANTIGRHRSPGSPTQSSVGDVPARSRPGAGARSRRRWSDCATAGWKLDEAVAMDATVSRQGERLRRASRAEEARARSMRISGVESAWRRWMRSLDGVHRRAARARRTRRLRRRRRSRPAPPVLRDDPRVGIMERTNLRDVRARYPSRSTVTST